jgi:hypothetical protein
MRRCPSVSSDLGGIGRRRTLCREVPSDAAAVPWPPTNRARPLRLSFSLPILTRAGNHGPAFLRPNATRTGIARPRSHPNTSRGLLLVCSSPLSGRGSLAVRGSSSCSWLGAMPWASLPRRPHSNARPRGYNRSCHAGVREKLAPRMSGQAPHWHNETARRPELGAQTYRRWQLIGYA